jgi:hypothetical protein
MSIGTPTYANIGTDHPTTSRITWNAAVLLPPPPLAEISTNWLAPSLINTIVSFHLKLYSKKQKTKNKSKYSPMLQAHPSSINGTCVRASEIKRTPQKVLPHLPNAEFDKDAPLIPSPPILASHPILTPISIHHPSNPRLPYHPPTSIIIIPALILQDDIQSVL